MTCAYVELFETAVGSVVGSRPTGLQDRLLWGEVITDEA